VFVSPLRSASSACLSALMVLALAVIGAPASASGACLDPAAPLLVEEQRLTGADGQPAPVPQEILDRSGFDRYSPAFTRALCAVHSRAAAERVVTAAGRLLWTGAVARVQGRAQAGGDLSRDDDRPLYWSRLQLSRTLRQWTPRFGLTAAQRADLIWRLERASRGQLDVEFGHRPGVKRILVSGFDPFTLDSDIRRSNPSGATALFLDGTVVSTPNGPARIETVTFPVNWTPFEQGIVEQAFLPYLRPGPNQVDAFSTISQGRPEAFDIERFNGRWHTGADNNREQRATTIPIPAGVPTVTPAPEFVPTTLPYAQIVAATTGRFPVRDNTSVTEIPVGGTVPVVRPNGPTPGSVARAGGGGSYLSNESAYRTTLLRDAVGARIPGGHIHTPVLLFAPDNTSEVTDPVQVQNRIDIRTQVRAILTIIASTL
jgi:pyrrolidone-carboxylate peptidase